MHLYIPMHYQRTDAELEADRITKVACDALLEAQRFAAARPLIPVVKLVRALHPGLSLVEAKCWVQHHYPHLWTS